MGSFNDLGTPEIYRYSKKQYVTVNGKVLFTNTKKMIMQYMDTNYMYNIHAEKITTCNMNTNTNKTIMQNIVIGVTSTNPGLYYASACKTLMIILHMCVNFILECCILS